jgi:hypothetical protein
VTVSLPSLEKLARVRIEPRRAAPSAEGWGGRTGRSSGRAAHHSYRPGASDRTVERANLGANFPFTHQSSREGPRDVPASVGTLAPPVDGPGARAGRRGIVTLSALAIIPISHSFSDGYNATSVYGGLRSRRPARAG